MKKLILLCMFLLSFSISAFADKEEVAITKHEKKPDNTVKRERAPMRIPLRVVYDTDTHIMEVTGPETIVAEVFIYDAAGTIVSYSPVLNSTLNIPDDPGTYTILIQSDSWYADGEIIF
mgnify:CR=1